MIKFNNIIKYYIALKIIFNNYNTLLKLINIIYTSTYIQGVKYTLKS